VVKTKSKGGLGRGLEALFAVSPKAGTNDNDKEKTAGLPVKEGEVVLLPLASVIPNPEQPRRVFAEQALAELAQSIKEQGLLQPVLVRPAADGVYQIIAGERRWRASKEAGLTSIPCLVKPLDDEAVLAASLIENVQRQDLGVLEEANTYKRLLNDYNYTQEEVARKIGKSRVHVANTVRLLSLPQSIQAHIASDLLSAGHARALLALPSAAEQEIVAVRAIKENWSVRQTEKYIAGKKKTTPRREVKKTVEHLAVKRLEERLRDRLGTRVQIGQKEMRVEFYSEDDLIRLLTLMGVDVSL